MRYFAFAYFLLLQSCCVTPQKSVAQPTYSTSANGGDLPVWYITSSGHDCDHAPLKVYATDSVNAWLKAKKLAKESNDAGALAMLSVPINHITVWKESDWLETQKHIEPGFTLMCQQLKLGKVTMP